jgi:hypothetical protein
MIYGAGDQPAKVIGVLSGTPATAFMDKKSNTIEIPEESVRGCVLSVFRQDTSLDLVCSPFAVKSRQLRNLQAIELWRSESQLLFKRLFEVEDVPVFTKNEWDDEPIVARTDLPVRSAVSEKFPVLPGRNIGWTPPKLLRFLVILGGFVANVAYRQQLALLNGFEGLADENTVHRDI